MTPSAQDIEDAIYESAQDAWTALRAQHADQHFYYFSLITCGEALAPFVSAWSRESVVIVAEKESVPVDYLKWSYAESPFCFFAEERFEKVRELFRLRPEPDDAAEVDLRMAAMEGALSRLNREGAFGIGQTRNEIVVLVEVMPPDFTNAQRARRLNPAEALADWLAEAAEE
jgi:hypothetical protein